MSTILAQDPFSKKLRVMNSDASPQETAALLRTVEEIRHLKRRKNAVVLSHFYMSPELQVSHQDGGIADFVGDSLALSMAAKQVAADYLVFCGVRFMAETAKILNPGKQVLLPSFEAGCSLAESITGAEVRQLKKQWPGVPVVAYINTYAETKAEADICCTSRNALDIARSLEGDKIIFLPDLFMGRNLQARIKAETGKELILWEGKCEVHEQFTPQRINGLKIMYPEAQVLVHWEVPDNTVNDALTGAGGVVGSTSDIIRFVQQSRFRQFILGSECDLGATLRGLFPEKEFIVPCIKCPHMKQITLDRTLQALQAIGQPEEKLFEVILPREVCQRALLPIERMLTFA
jgi:quinolinate synthase